MGKVLVACERSQVVCSAFRSLGVEAYSCDILAAYGDHPEWHISLSPYTSEIFISDVSPDQRTLCNDYLSSVYGVEPYLSWS